MPTTYLNAWIQPHLCEGVLYSTPNSIIRLHHMPLRIPNSNRSILISNRTISNSYEYCRKWKIMANSDVVGEEEKKAFSAEEETRKKPVSKQSSGKGFVPPKAVASASKRKKGGNDGKGPKERKSSSPIIRRTPLEKPFAVPPGEPKIEESEGAFLLSWAALGILILVEGIVLAASGFLPEDWDNFLVKYLYPAFTPTVAVFFVGAAAYGLYKYLGGGLQKS